MDDPTLDEYICPQENIFPFYGGGGGRGKEKRRKRSYSPISIFFEKKPDLYV